MLPQKELSYDDIKHYQTIIETLYKTHKIMEKLTNICI